TTCCEVAFTFCRSFSVRDCQGVGDVSRYSSSDESFARLQRAGWSVGDVRVLTASGPRWLVTGTNGMNAIRAEGATQAEAWQRACEQAETVGMPGQRTAE